MKCPPGRPTNLTAEAYADGIPQEEIQLTWDSPTDGGSTRQYRIDISENGGTTWYALESDVRNTRYLHADLLANETFTYRVFATNQHGISAVSNDDSGTTANSWVPARPARLTADVGTESSTPAIADTETELTITLDWNEPVDPPGAPVTSYVVEYSIDGEVWDPAEKSTVCWMLDIPTSTVWPQLTRLGGVDGRPPPPTPLCLGPCLRRLRT